MKSRSLFLRLFTVFVAVLAIAFALTSGGFASTPTPTPDTTCTELASPTSGHMGPGMNGMPASGNMGMGGTPGHAMMMNVEFDRAFIDMMISHHQSAIMMAQAALQHAQHQELKELAHDIIDAQQREIDQMKGWRAAWCAEATPGTPAAETTATVVNVTVDEFTVTTALAAFHTGQTYRFVVTNTGALPHEFMVLPDMAGIGQKDMEELHHVALGVIPVDDLAPGATREIDVTFAQAGEYQLVCALTGHYDAGMTLVISAGN